MYTSADVFPIDPSKMQVQAQILNKMELTGILLQEWPLVDFF